MNTKLIIILSFTYLYGFFEIFMAVRQRHKRKIVKSGDRLSIWILALFISIGYALSFSIASTKTGRIYHWDLFFIAGAILAISGLILRISSILTLKQQFTYTVTKIENHDLIETGLYKIIQTSWIFRTVDYFSWDFNFIIKLVIYLIHDYFGFNWIPLPD